MSETFALQWLLALPPSSTPCSKAEIYTQLRAERCVLSVFLGLSGQFYLVNAELPWVLSARLRFGSYLRI